jgi:hypothetical protein
MSDTRQEAIERISRAITSVLMKEGRLIESGFRMFILLAYTDGVPTNAGIPVGVSKEQYDALRNAFFAGAQHLFGSLSNGFDESAEPTEGDMRKMSLINSELTAFVTEFKRKHGLGDEPQARQ